MIISDRYWKAKDLIITELKSESIRKRRRVLAINNTKIYFKSFIIWVLIVSVWSKKLLKRNETQQKPYFNSNNNNSFFDCFNKFIKS